MKAIISGTAAGAMLVDKVVEYRPLGLPPIVGIPPSGVGRIFEGCDDTRFVEVSSATEVDKLTEAAWANDRALRLFLFMVDPEETLEDAREFAECVEELLEDESVSSWLLYRLCANVLPIMIEVNRIQDACATAPKTYGIFSFVLKAQDKIRIVFSAFDETDATVFGGSEEKRQFRQSLVSDGYFYRIVCLLLDEASLSFIRLQIVAKYREFSSATQAFLSKIQPLSRMPRDVLMEEEPEQLNGDDSPNRDGNHEAFEKVKAQQRGIIDRLRVRDIASARRFAAQLVEDQKNISNSEHIAKSLCLLSQEARHYELDELQLEWAELANEFGPTDPMTAGHLADALIRVGRIVDAYAAIDAAEKRGDPLFAATARARIKRIEGKYHDAFDLYMAAASSFNDQTDVFYAWCGAADALRHMGKYEAALALYDKEIINRWPRDGIIRVGYASTLLEADCYYDAIKQFNIALQHGGGVAAEVGRATAFRHIGQISEALHLYDQVLEIEPCNSAALCGRAETFRATDNLGRAREAYELALAKAAFSPRPWGGLAATLTDLGEYQKAKELLAEAEQLFPNDEFIALGVAKVLRREGDLQKALNAYDRLSKRFPFNPWILWAAGDVMRRLGLRTAALEKMDDILGIWPDYILAKLSKAAILIEEQKYSLASAILAENDMPAYGWQGYVLKAIIQKKSNKSKDALATLSAALNNFRLPRERRFIRCAIASLDLHEDRAEAAAYVAEPKRGEITNIVHFHALAASGDRKAVKMFKQLLSIGENNYDPIVVEIARRYKIMDGKPSHNKEWIIEQEQALLIQEII